MCHWLIAQNTIKTPTNVTVDVILFSEFSSGDLAQIEAIAANWIISNGSNAVRVAPASQTYNCHAYAWHTKDGGNNVWINAHTSSGNNDPVNLKKYWDGTNSSYVITSASQATVAYYGSCWVYTGGYWKNDCDHSAQVISPNVFESKWGVWPRYRHAPADVPYVATNITYYQIPINGSGTTCFSPQTYNSLNISSASYTWSGDMVSISGSGHSVSVTGANSGQGSVTVSISSPFSGTTVSGRKNVWVGTPQSSEAITGGTYTYEFTQTSYSVISVSGATHYNWQVPSGWTGGGLLTSNIANVTVGPNSGYVSVTPQNSCGTASGSQLYVTVNSCQNCRAVDIYPNPADNNISINPNSKESQQETINVEIEGFVIFDLQGRLMLKSDKNTRLNPNAIEVSALPKGMYMIHLMLNNGEMVTKRIIIDR